MGIPKFIDDKYLASMEEKRLSKVDNKKNQQQKLSNQEKQKSSWSDRVIRSGNRDVEIVDVAMLNDNTGKNIYKTGEPITVLVDYKVNKPVESADFTIGIARDDGIYCYGSGVMLDSQKPSSIQEKGQVQIQLTQNELLPGKYFLDVGIQSADGVLYDAVCSVLEFHITTDRVTEYGIVSMKHIWQVDGKQIEKV